MSEISGKTTIQTLEADAGSPAFADSQGLDHK
jgi:hypothetical protein